MWNNLQRSVNFDVTVSASGRGAALIRGRRLLIFLSQMRRLFEGGAYSSKYGMREITQAPSFNA